MPNDFKVNKKNFRFFRLRADSTTTKVMCNNCKDLLWVDNKHYGGAVVGVYYQMNEMQPKLDPTQAPAVFCTDEYPYGPVPMPKGQIDYECATFFKDGSPSPGLFEYLGPSFSQKIESPKGDTNSQKLIEENKDNIEILDLPPLRDYADDREWKLMCKCGNNDITLYGPLVYPHGNLCCCNDCRVTAQWIEQQGGRKEIKAPAAAGWFPNDFKVTKSDLHLFKLRESSKTTKVMCKSCKDLLWVDNAQYDGNVVGVYYQMNEMQPKLDATRAPAVFCTAEYPYGRVPAPKYKVDFHCEKLMAGGAPVAGLKDYLNPAFGKKIENPKGNTTSQKIIEENKDNIEILGLPPLIDYEDNKLRFDIRFNVEEGGKKKGGNKVGGRMRNTMMRNLFEEGNEDAKPMDYIVLVSVVVMLAIGTLALFSGVFGVGPMVYAVLVQSAALYFILCFLTVMSAMLLHIFNIYAWEGAKKYAVASIVLTFGFMGGIFIAKKYPACPIICISLLWPMCIALVRYGRAGKVSGRSFYGVTMIACAIGAILCGVIWLLYSLGYGFWNADTNLKMQNTDPFKTMQEEYAIANWDVCINWRAIQETDPNNADATIIKNCQRLELLAFMVHSCPLIEAMIMGAIGAFAGLRVAMMGRADAPLKLVFVGAGVVVGGVWVASSVAGGSAGAANVFLAGVMVWAGVLAVWVAFSQDVKDALAKAEDSVLVQTAKPIMQGEPFAAFMLCGTVGPLTMWLGLEVVARQAQKAIGYQGQSPYITDRGLRAVNFILSKHWAMVLNFTFLLSMAYIMFKLFAIFTPVFLGILGGILATMNFFVVLLIFFVVGFIMFMLPPVPGVPVYVAAGSICVTRGVQEPWLHFWPTVVLISAYALLIKFAAVVGQQKGIGEMMGSNVAIQQAVGVHTPTIKAIEKILQQPGMSIKKVCILCGGPDWPTSVLTGILKLSCPQMLLGTVPCFFLILPCVLAGAALSNPDVKSMAPLFMMAAAGTQGGMGMAAMAFVAAAQEKYADELSKVRPEHEVLIQQSEEAAKATARLKRALAWKKLGVLQKFCLIMAVTWEWLGAAMCGAMGSACFRTYAIGTDIDASFEDGGLEGSAMNLFIAPMGHGVLGLMFFGIFWYILYKILNKAMIKLPPETE
eukprot:TRINITY_DN8361_c0_g2_i1.p1 TRINITY_DN8361_c0_g2~~TRINITY_DN8361_c0_g2_i1.p1  ORF type:complete len:1189 (-),score=282.38 TRINITY_DN8361_c0_g2_i1:94-3510(-)